MAQRIKIVQVRSRVSMPYELGDTPIVADHVAEDWIEAGWAEPYDRPTERATDEPAAEQATREPAVDATDAARALAADAELDLAEIEGSGKGGRVLKSDVEAAVE